ncbi:MAG: caspase domain-containing protein [Muribaculaceae bacterium]|nr:caspase family protein [Muribaculaceae bacterium]
MKRIIFALMLALMAVGAIQARTFVLITGVSNYYGAANDLGQTTKDAKNFRDVMATQTKDITILTSKNVTYDNVMEKLSAICNRAQAKDRIIFFYSGHGAPGYICATDRLIPYEDVVEKLSKSAAGEKIVFVDACFAGTMTNAATGNAWATTAGKNGMAFLLASAPQEVSAESPFLGAGYFTQALIKGIRGKADFNGDKKITMAELAKYVIKDVKIHSNDTQHPKLVGSKSMAKAVIATWPAPVKK